MARSFNAASTRYLQHNLGVSISPALGYSMSAWFYPTSSTSTQCIAGIARSTTNSNSVHLLSGGSLSGDPVRIQAGSQFATSTTGFNLNAWNHVGGYARAASGTDARGILLNGGGKGTSTGLSTPEVADRIMVGRRSASTPDLYFDGRVAEFAIWSVVLEDAEFIALAQGVPAWEIRTESLYGYWPLFGEDSPENDWSPNNRTLSLTNSPGKVDHPPILPQLGGGLWIPVGIELGGGDQTVNVDPVVATFTVPGVTTASAGLSVNAAPVTATFTVPGVTVSLGTAHTVNADPVAATFTVPAVTTERSVSAAPVTATFTVPGVTVALGGVVVSVDPITATFTVPGVSATLGGIAVSADPVVATFAVPSVSLTQGDNQTVFLDPATATFTVPGVTTTLGPGLSVSVDPVGATFAVPGVTTALGPAQTVSALPVTATFTVPGVTTAAGGAQTVAASPVVMTLSVPAVVAALGAVSVSALPVTATFAVPAVTTTGGVFVEASVWAGRVLPGDTWVGVVLPGDTWAGREV